MVYVFSVKSLVTTLYQVYHTSSILPPHPRGLTTLYSDGLCLFSSLFVSKHPLSSIPYLKYPATPHPVVCQLYIVMVYVFSVASSLVTTRYQVYHTSSILPPHPRGLTTLYSDGLCLFSKVVSNHPLSSIPYLKYPATPPRGLTTLYSDGLCLFSSFVVSNHPLSSIPYLKYPATPTPVV